MKPAWLKLLEQWRSESNFGLTIPFLIGALREWPSKPLGEHASSFEQMRALLTSIRDDAPEGTIVRLYNCDRIGDLALAPVSGIPEHCFPTASPTRSKPAFYVEKGTVDTGNETFQGLLNALWQRYRNHIEGSRFSLRSGAFHPLNDSEKRLINTAVTQPEGDV